MPGFGETYGEDYGYQQGVPNVPSTTFKVNAVPDAYSLVAAGAAYDLVSLQAPRLGAVRVVFAGSLPAADSDDCFVLAGSDGLQSFALDTATNIYAKAVDVGATVRGIRRAV